MTKHIVALQNDNLDQSHKCEEGTNYNSGLPHCLSIRYYPLVAKVLQPQTILCWLEIQFWFGIHYKCQNDYSTDKNSNKDKTPLKWKSYHKIKVQQQLHCLLKRKPNKGYLIPLFIPLCKTARLFQWIHYCIAFSVFHRPYCPDLSFFYQLVSGSPISDFDILYIICINHSVGRGKILRETWPSLGLRGVRARFLRSRTHQSLQWKLSL